LIVKVHIYKKERALFRVLPVHILVFCGKPLFQATSLKYRGAHISFHIFLLVLLIRSSMPLSRGRRAWAASTPDLSPVCFAVYYAELINRKMQPCCYLLLLILIVTYNIISVNLMINNCFKS